MDIMFCPGPWQGTPDRFTRHDVYDWVSDLPTDKKIYCCFWQGWDNKTCLPPNYDFYLISWHIENVDLEWLKEQRSRVDGKFIVLFPGNSYSYFLPDTEFISYNELHRDIDRMIDWHGIDRRSHVKKFKFSAICNRATQSKIWVTTKLLEVSGHDSLIIHNPDFLQEKNVHSWQLSGNRHLDQLTKIYLEKYQTLRLSDGFQQSSDNMQTINSNPWQPQYTETALHFTNGSFHYSYMEDANQKFIYPGPDIDEKTLKCLVAGTPFIACGQFEIYRTLAKAGLEFEYEFDLSWDTDPGNLTRFEKICELIDYLSQYSVSDIVEMTRKSTIHNTEFILKKGFYSRCETQRKLAVEKLFDCIGNNQ